MERNLFYEQLEMDSMPKEKDSAKDMIFKIIDDGMRKKDRYVTIFFGSKDMSVSIYPKIEGDVDARS